MLQIIAADHVPYRPIVTNHAPKNHHLLTKPRHQMRIPSHGAPRIWLILTPFFADSLFIYSVLG